MDKEIIVKGYYLQYDKPEFPFNIDNRRWERVGKNWLVKENCKELGHPNPHYINGHPDGYGGREFTFTLTDESVITAKGVWAGNCDDILKQTGKDFTDTYLTIGFIYQNVEVVSKNPYVRKYTGIVYQDQEWVKGKFKRIEILRDSMLDENPEKYKDGLAFIMHSSGGAQGSIMKKPILKTDFQ